MKQFLIIFSTFLISLTIISCKSSDDGSTSTDNTTTTDTTAPTVSSIYPNDNQSGVSITTDNITVTFSEVIDNTTTTTNTDNSTCYGSFQLSSDNFSGCVQMSSSPSNSNSNKTFTINPSDNLSYSTTYKIRVTTGVKDSAGNTLSNQYETSNGFTTESLFLVGGSSGTILTSSDGTTWTSRTSGTSETIRAITYANSTFVVVGFSGTILTSSDGTTWTSRTSGTSNKLLGVTYASNTFVAVGKDGTILTSSDGTTWTSRTSGTSNDFNGVTYANSTFVAVGSSGTILTSSDGTTWTSRTSGTSNELY